MHVTILGCGGSGGVPLVGPDGWGACDPANPKNRRRRVSILVEAAGTTILVDTSPDLREQLLGAGTWDIDAVVYTHAHADHSHGIDDLRAVNYHRRCQLDVYARRETLDELRQRFAYAFPAEGARDLSADQARSFYRPWLMPRPITGPFRIGAIDVVPFDQVHGSATCLGYRFGRVAYSTDVKALDEAAFATLAGIDVWIVDCLREAPHGTHSHLAQTLAWIERVKPGRAILTHMNHSLDYATLRARLPAGVEPAYDGMVIEID